MYDFENFSPRQKLFLEVSFNEEIDCDQVVRCLKKIVYETSNDRGIDFLSLKLDWKNIIVSEGS